MEVPGYSKTFSMDQGRIPGNGQLFHALYSSAPLNAPKREGFGSGLSIIWVARCMMFDKEGAEERRSGLVSMGGFRFGGHTQDINRGAGTGPGSAEDQYRAMFEQARRPFALRIVPGLVVDNAVPVSIARLAEAVQVARTDCLFSIGRRTPGGGAGDMIAIHIPRDLRPEQLLSVRPEHGRIQGQ